MQASFDNIEHTGLQPVATLNEPDIIIGSREQIFYLLAEASEIEHTLMCNYLYAVFSLKSGIDSGLSETEAKAVEGWRKLMMGMAIEEMGHLLIVANLTAAIGGLPHFARPNFPVSSGYFPSGVTLKLTPFNQETLDHFIFLERPMGTEAEDGEGFEETGIEREQGYSGLMPSAQDYATVSHLYEAIRANLIALSERSGEATLFIGQTNRQIGPELIQMSGIEVIKDLAGAMQAIDLIVEQGEGSSAETEDSHYRRFQQIKDQYLELLIQNPDFAPSHPVAENPVMRRPIDESEKVFIDAQPAAQVLDLSNAIYGTLLRFLIQAYTKIDADSGKERMVSAAFELMHILGTVSKILSTLPASSMHPNINAGMTFTMLRSVEPYLKGSAESVLIYEKLIQLSTGASRLAKKVPELVSIEKQLMILAKNFKNEVSQHEIQ